MADLSSLFQPLEDAIRLSFLPALLRREITDLERDIISLPARFGGLGISIPTVDCVSATQGFVSEPLMTLVERQESDLLILLSEQRHIGKFRNLSDVASSTMHEDST